MKNLRIIPLIALAFSFLSCGDTGVIPREDPTDEDAIYNIIRYDRPSEFNIDLLDFSIPDTIRLNQSNIVVNSYWYELDSVFYDIEINITRPQPGDSLGSVPEADVRVAKVFSGIHEIIGTDTSGGGSVPVRLSSNLRISGEMLAEFDKLGFDFDDRRGWILRKISDVSYRELAAEQGQIIINSNSYPDHQVDPSIKNVSETLTFAPGESLTVAVTYNSRPDVVRLRYPAANVYQTIVPQHSDTATYTTGFRIPNSVAYNHFLVIASWFAAQGDSTEVSTSGIGVLYRAR